MRFETMPSKSIQQACGRWWAPVASVPHARPNDIKVTFRSTVIRGTPKLSTYRTMGVQMIRLFSSAMLLTVSVAGSALAIAAVPGVPSPEIGGGMVGMMVAAGVVYLINRRRSRS